MRIGLLSGELAPGHDGVSDYTIRLADALRDLGADPKILTTTTRAAGVADAIGVAEGWDRRGVVAAARVIRRLGLDVLHVQFAPSAYGYQGAVGALPLLLGRRLPLVTTLHEYGWWTWRPAAVPEQVALRLWGPAEAVLGVDRETILLAPRSAAVVVTNPAHAAVAGARLPRARVVTVPIGPNLDGPALGAAGASRVEARRRLRTRIGATPSAEVLVFFGFVHPVKGIPHLLEATIALRRSRPELAVVIAGGIESLALRGGEADLWKAEVGALVAGAGLDEVVTLTGHLPAAEVSECLLGGDVGVLPFNAGVTGKSGSLMAVLDHGLPCVGTVADPPDPGLVDGRELLLVPRRDSAALADAIERVLGDAYLAAELVGGGHHYVADGRSWPAIARAHLDLYGSL